MMDMRSSMKILKNEMEMISYSVNPFEFLMSWQYDICFHLRSTKSLTGKNKFEFHIPLPLNLS